MEPQTAIDVERAFAADAQRIGQWAAFRKWAAADATMFAPQPTRAQEWLKDRKEPAKAVEWWPTASWTSCDGTLAVNTGGSRWPNGGVGYFTTVWKKQPDGQWRWVLDHGGDLKVARLRQGRVVAKSASCSPPFSLLPDPLVIYPAATKRGTYVSQDRSLVADWLVTPNQFRRVQARMVHLAQPSGYPRRLYLMPVLTDEVAAPAP